MTKKISLYEAALATLGSLTRADAEGTADMHAAAHVHLIEKMLKKASLTKTQRVRADAALYQALKLVSGVAREDMLTGNAAVELPIPGDSAADKQLQGVMQGIHKRRAESATSVAQDA